MPKMVNFVLKDVSLAVPVDRTFQPVDRYSDSGVAKWEEFQTDGIPGVRDSLTVGVRAASGSKDRRASSVLRLKQAKIVTGTDGRQTIATQPITCTVNLDIDNTATEAQVKTAVSLLVATLQRADVQEALGRGAPFVL